MTGILIDTESEDLMLQGGHLALGDLEQQTVEMILLTAPGEWKECPLLGADARSQLGGNTDVMWAQQTKKMIRACGVDVKSVSIADDGTINIE